MNRNDPNHTFQRIGDLRTKLVSGRFVDTDTRVFDFTRYANDHPDFTVQLLSTRRLIATLTDEVLEGLEELERRTLADCASRMQSTLLGVQQQQFNGHSSLDANHERSFATQFQRFSGTLGGVFVSRFLSNEAALAELRADVSSNVESVLNNVKSDADQLRHRIQQDLTQAAVAKNANFFRTEASRYAHLSIWWGLACVVWFGLLIIGAGFVAFDASFTGEFLAELKAYVPSMPDQWLLLQVLASKLFVVGALTYVGVVLVRAFMSVLNAHITNRHRAVSLDTYKFLLDGAQTDADRQAIIQRAAEAVFALQETGLIKSVPGSEAAPFNTTINLPKLT